MPGKEPKAKPKHSLAGNPYVRTSDRSLRPCQAKSGLFSETGATGGNFRAASNLTLGGYSSGYHESAVTTDTFVFLRDATKNKDGTHTLPSQVPKGSFYENYRGKKVNSQVLEWVLKHADGFRTDTAQTILSAPGGDAAGHSGSDLDTSGQSAAHDLLRQAIMDILEQNPTTTSGLTERSVVVTMAAITVASMAPGEIARTIQGGGASLKAGGDALMAWEERRNRAKRRVEKVFNSLTGHEKNFVNTNASLFIDSTQTSSLRKVPNDRATSPERVEKAGGLNMAQGGPYKGGTLKSKAVQSLDPDVAPPANWADAGMYFTQFGRGWRVDAAD